MYPLMEHQAFAGTMQREMMAEVERANPKYIVSVSVPFSWLLRPDSDRTIMFYAQKKVDSGLYQIDGIVDELPDGTVYVWGADALRYRPRTASIVFLLRRVSSPRAHATAATRP